ncbi:MAG: BON domain-containing protein [Acidobacteriota bacterium]|nr:BON domain-containing protein [Acidobacteriota bacterium]
MKNKNTRKMVAVSAAVIAGALLGIPQTLRASQPAYAAANSAAATQQDIAVARAAEAKLNKDRFGHVTVQVENGIATLRGTVSLYEYKADAEKRVLQAKGISAVRNLIQVTSPAISDHDLQAKLAEKLSYDRVGFGNVFNAISVQVQNGVVTLGGHARTYVDRDSALALVSTTPGVKDVISNIEVDPVSIMDDQTRMAVARAVYGYPSLNKYALNPARPIRISVQNGHVELYGVVDSQADKNTAGLRANTVPGVFSVKNYLEVANEPAEKPRK